MDTTTKIMMKILEDMYSNGKSSLHANYSDYYESLDETQPKIVVSDAIKKILSESSNATCEFGEDDFFLQDN